ncbi:MAG: 2-C-methyl-D-erythritol 4-phosphate cytidylyltransferase [bacterium]
MKAWAIIAGAGIGRRMGGATPKQYLEIGGRPIVCHTLDRFRDTRSIESAIIVVEPGREQSFRDDILMPFGYPAHWIVTAGGAVRQQSVANGLALVPTSCDVVAVHDAVRPFVTAAQIDTAVEMAYGDGAAIIAARLNETVKRVRNGGTILETVDRSELWAARTPQCFRREILIVAMERAMRDGFTGTDEASIVERLGHTVRIIEGDPRNIKITTPADIVVAEAILKEWYSQTTPLLCKEGIGEVDQDLPLPSSPYKGEGCKT